MASQQPPAGRTWFRLASLARMEAANAAAATAAPQSPTTPPVPRIPIPQSQQQPLPPLPAPEMQTPPLPPPEPRTEIPSQLQQPGIQAQPYPMPPPIIPRQPSPSVLRTAMPPESPKVILPSYPTRPPSPIAEQRQPAAEPPIQQKIDQESKALPQPPQLKTITVPEESKTRNDNGSRYNQQMQDSLVKSSNGNTTISKVEEAKGLRILTMAGENAGAIMELGSAAQRRVGHQNAGRRVKGYGDEHGQVKDSDMKPDEKEKTKRLNAKTKHMIAVVNSNVQSINNSIVLNSTCSQQSPGVHITFASHRWDKSGNGSPTLKAQPNPHRE